MPPSVVAPTILYENSFLEMVHEYAQLEPQHAEIYLPARDDFAAYVKSLQDEELGRNLPVGWVPCTHRWLVQDQDVVAVVRVRHHIGTAFLAESAGHIGYDVRPARRRQGFGLCAMRAGLVEARARGIVRALLYTGAENLASRTIIERCGGSLESISFSPFWKEQLCRYWVPVPNGA